MLFLSDDSTSGNSLETAVLSEDAGVGGTALMLGADTGCARKSTPDALAETPGALEGTPILAEPPGSEGTGVNWLRIGLSTGIVAEEGDIDDSIGDAADVEEEVETVV